MQKRVAKSVKAGELILDAIDPNAPEDKSAVAEYIFAKVYKDSATDTTRHVEALHKKACGCIRMNTEYI